VKIAGSGVKAGWLGRASLRDRLKPVSFRAKAQRPGGPVFFRPEAGRSARAMDGLLLRSAPPWTASLEATPPSGRRPAGLLGPWMAEQT